MTEPACAGITHHALARPARDAGRGAGRVKARRLGENPQLGELVHGTSLVLSNIRTSVLSIPYARQVTSTNVLIIVLDR